MKIKGRKKKDIKKSARIEKVLLAKKKCPREASICTEHYTARAFQTPARDGSLVVWSG